MCAPLVRDTSPFPSVRDTPPQEACSQIYVPVARGTTQRGPTFRSPTSEIYVRMRLAAAVRLQMYALPKSQRYDPSKRQRKDPPKSQRYDPAPQESMILLSPRVRDTHPKSLQML